MEAAGWVGDMATRLGQVEGVVGVMLGGSRARGDHLPESDYDLGLYYQAPLNTKALLLLAQELSGPDAVVSEPGDWGPWVDGGAWLQINGVAVDWIYRDLDRVEDSWKQALSGHVEFHTQVGHPLGVPGFAYAGEVALGVLLDDPSGRLTAVHSAAQQYPDRLAAAIIDRLWEADFLLGGLSKSIKRADSVWTSGCLFRIVMLCVHALYARASRWLINEKGAVAAAERSGIVTSEFAQRARSLLAHTGSTLAELSQTVSTTQALVIETRAACGAAPRSAT